VQILPQLALLTAAMLASMLRLLMEPAGNVDSVVGQCCSSRSDWVGH
jgi:hypothetical protein